MACMESFRILLGLFAVFFKIGAVTFGGGYAMLPMLETELAVKRNWTSSELLLDYFAIGQSTPGIIAVNVATFVGFNKKGIPGACVATAGIVCPSIIVITVIALCIGNFADIWWVQKALVGINISVAALLTYSVVGFARKSVRGMAGATLFSLSFMLIFFFKVNSIVIIIASAVLGIALHVLRGRREARNGTGR